MLPMGRNLFGWQMVTKSQLNFLIASVKIIFARLACGVRACGKNEGERGMRMAPAVAPINNIFTSSTYYPLESEWVIAVRLAVLLRRCKSRSPEKAQRASFTQLLRASLLLLPSRRREFADAGERAMNYIGYTYCSTARCKLSGRHSCLEPLISPEFWSLRSRKFDEKACFNLHTIQFREQCGWI